ncbi:unnamed protein product [Blepharisma stoltei]|uniref:Uncharacterized protein n=1 Tax=Blepharisma stoltei TaxID=1481888 RepID=A0AAU9J8K6_9CILI|nr:unnamed protein product [Blepharisma stoltei]
MTKGINDGLNSPFFIDSNAVECFSNTSAECYDLFTRELILPTLQICDNILPKIKSNLVDKLIEALLNIINKLPKEEMGAAIKRVLSYVDNELKNLNIDDTAESRQKYSKCVIIWASALNSLSSIDSGFLNEVLGEMVTQALDIICRGLLLYRSQDGVIVAVSLFFKRIIKAFTCFSDPYFPIIANCILQCYSPGHEDCLGVISNAISIIGNEANTRAWLEQNYINLFGLLISYLEAKPEPGIIVGLFEIQTKLYESGNPALNNIQVVNKTLETVCRLLPIMTDRNPCKAVLQFTQLLFQQEGEEWKQILFPYARLMTKAILFGLGNINSNTFLILALLVDALKGKYFQEYYNGVVEGLQSPLYANFSEKEKERLLYCFLNAESSPAIMMIKQFFFNLANILKGVGTFESVIMTEIAIASSKRAAKVIDIA